MANLSVAQAATVRIPSSKQHRIRINTGNIVAFAILAVLSLLALVPVVWIISNSFKETPEIFSYPPMLMPEAPTISGYTGAFSTMPFARYFLNTTFVTLLRVAATVVSASIVAYGFARYNAPGKNLLFIVVLSPLFLPEVITLVPLFIGYQQIRWIDTYYPLIIPALFGGKAIYVFLMRQFFLTIPSELDDAARIDGASEFGILWRIILPLSRPALATVAIFTFLESWNDFLTPLIFINSDEKSMVTVGLAKLATGQGDVPWNSVMGITFLSILPPLILFIVAQRYFVQGVATTGLKG